MEFRADARDLVVSQLIYFMGVACLITAFVTWLLYQRKDVLDVFTQYRVFFILFILCMPWALWRYYLFLQTINREGLWIYEDKIILIRGNQSYDIPIEKIEKIQSIFKQKVLYQLQLHIKDSQPIKLKHYHQIERISRELHRITEQKS